MKKSIIRSKQYVFASITSSLIMWKIASFIYNNEAILPPPENVFLALVNLLQSPDSFLFVGAYTFARFLGFTISLILGIVLGTLSGLKPAMAEFLSPILTILKSTPIISIILLLLIWFGTENTPIVATILVAFPILYTNILEGTRQVDRKLINMAKLYKSKRLHIIKDIYLPSTTPFIFSGMETAFSIGWKVTVTSEVISQPFSSIGRKMWDAKIYVEIEQIFAWTILTIIISYFIELLIRSIRKRVVRWDTNYGS